MTAEAMDARWGSWTRRLARRVLSPFTGTRLRPNHITTLRIVVGVGACLAFAEGEAKAVAWGGALWMISAFLDRCDGEFARMTGRGAYLGRVYDLSGDIGLNSLVFLAIGIGLWDAAAGGWGLALGALAAGGIAVASVCAELNEWEMAPGRRTFNGAWGFDFDDLIYLIAPFAWFGVLDLLLYGGAVGGPVAAVVMAWKLARRRTGQLPDGG